MRETDRDTGKLFNYASPESPLPQDHRLLLRAVAGTSSCIESTALA